VKGRDLLENFFMDGRIILKCILHKEFEYIDLIQLVIIHISYNFNTNLFIYFFKIYCTENQ